MTSLFLSQFRLDEKARQRPRTPPARERVPSAPAQADARTLAALEHRAALQLLRRLQDPRVAAEVRNRVAFHALERHRRGG